MLGLWLVSVSDLKPIQHMYMQDCSTWEETEQEQCDEGECGGYMVNLLVLIPQLCKWKKLIWTEACG